MPQGTIRGKHSASKEELQAHWLAPYSTPQDTFTSRCYLGNSILNQCNPMSEDILMEAHRAVAAIKRYIEDKVPSTVKLS
jgi:hypothetical protein